VNDFITKATFSFVMAQLFPGAILVFSIAFIYVASGVGVPNSVLATSSLVLGLWNSSSVAHQLFLLVLCIGAGMFIHGLHWTVLGYLENRFGSVCDSYWSSKPLWAQLLLGPIKMSLEVGSLFRRIQHIRDTTLKENAPAVHKDLMPQFQFVEEFYLYSAQFFAHTAYALLGVIMAITLYAVLYGFTGRRLILWLIAYGVSGLFFILGRVQLNSLFTAEEQIVQRSTWIKLGASATTSASDD
jgi:hypothetical protein